MTKPKVTAHTTGPATLPVNVDTCQVEIRTEVGANNMFRIGARPTVRECGALVTYIGMAGGGAMGLCTNHMTMARKEIAGFTCQPIQRAK